MTRVAVASRTFSRHTELREALRRRYSDVTFNDAGLSLSGDGLRQFLRGHDKAIIALERIDDAVLAAVPELRVVSKFGVGLDMLDLPAMSRRGVKLGWRSGVNRRSVAELALAFAISLLRHIPQGHAALRAGEWKYQLGRTLSGRIVGIVGCGHIGKELVRLLAPFACTVLAHDIRPDVEFFKSHAIQSVGLDELLSQAEVVSLHLPLTSLTRNLLDARRLALLKPSAVLINTARGGIVDQAALKAKLSNGLLAAAAFDVFAVEPPRDRDLVALPNFLATPHIGGAAAEAVLAMGLAAIAGLDEFGEPLEVAGEHA